MTDEPLEDGDDGPGGPVPKKCDICGKPVSQCPGHLDPTPGGP